MHSDTTVLCKNMAQAMGYQSYSSQQALIKTFKENVAAMKPSKEDDTPATLARLPVTMRSIPVGDNAEQKKEASKPSQC